MPCPILRTTSCPSGPAPGRPGQAPAARASVIAVVTRTGVGGMIETASKDPLFEFDILQVDVARWLDIGQRGTRAVRQTWTAP